MVKEFLTFAKAAVKNPMEVSTVFPTTRFLANKMLDQVDFAVGKEFLELGSGSGAITKHISRRMESSQNFLGIEISEDMVQFLRTTFPDMQFKAASADALSDFVGEESVDGVISSLPWTLFPRELQERIIDEIIKVLADDGVFVTFICSNALFYPGARRFFQISKKKFPYFKRVGFVVKNMPPSLIFIGRKTNPRKSNPL